MERVSFPIRIDEDNIYERPSLLRRLFNLSITPILNRINEYTGSKLISTSRQAITVKKNATQYRALEAIYQYKNSVGKINSKKEKFFTEFWFNLLNPIAVRNRLRLVEKELLKSANVISSNPIHILSIGSGSARAVIETGIELIKREIEFKAFFVDKSLEALSYSRELAESFNLTSNCRWIQDRAENILYYKDKIQPDIIEMVGLLDYFEKQKAMSVMKQIYLMLKPGGVLLTCNILDNPERPFITKIIKWPLIYRDEEELFLLALEGGFEASNIEIILEPLKIHAVAKVKKNNFITTFNQSEQ